MKIILVGYPGSQHIVPASTYLTNKYLPGFDIRYLNYEGPKEGWSEFLANYLDELNDALVVLALDDYLISAPINMRLWNIALDKFKYDKVANVKLCRTTYEEHEDYPVTTQYTIWNRQFLIDLLKQTKNPWDFELHGSIVFKYSDWQAISGMEPVIEYDVHSCLSNRWGGINLNGVQSEDIIYLQTNKLI